MSSQSELNQAWLLGAATIVTVMLLVRYTKAFYDKLRFEYEYMKHPRLVPFDERRACAAEHSWSTVKLVLRGLPPGDYQVCSSCGVVGGGSAHNHLGRIMVSLEVLAQMKEGLEIAAKHDALKKEVEDRIDAITENLIAKRVERDFPADASDVTFLNKMMQFSDYVFEARNEAAEKVQAEIDAKNRLEAKYAGWSSRVKGNA